VLARLTEAVGDLIAPDTEANRRRRRRIAADAWRAGTHPLPPRTARQLGAADLVDLLTGAWLSTLNRVIGDPDSTQLLDEALHLGARLRQAEQALAEAGGPVLSDYGRADGRSRLRGVGTAHLD
jgi:hypothetical protein